MVDLIKEKEDNSWLEDKWGSHISEEARLKVEEEEILWLEHGEEIYILEKIRIKTEYYAFIVKE